MRVLYLDLDSLRADQLGCYGYPRPTSPTIDRLAREGTRFTNCYVSDAPCLPSRSALALGRFGLSSGVVNHGGLVSEPFPLGTRRGFSGAPGYQTLFQALRAAEMYPVSVTPFPNRHVAPWFTLGLREWYNTGRGGFEHAHEVNAVAEPWLETHAAEDGWFLHVNYWDAHTPYRVPNSYPSPFAAPADPGWLTQDILDAHWHSYGPNSAQDSPGVWARQMPERVDIPHQLRTLADYQAWLEGYDVGLRYIDDHIARLLTILERAGVLDDTLILISADHGENQGELNVYGDHQTADHFTSRVPFVARGPGFAAGQINTALHYQFDLMAAVLRQVGGDVPGAWDARPPDLTAGTGRPHLVLSQMAWTCQRSVRWDKYLCLRTYHDGYKDLPPLLLFDLEADPHELHDLSAQRPELVAYALERLDEFVFDGIQRSPLAQPYDPMHVVLREGGPWQVRGRLGWYTGHLRDTGRAHHAEALLARHAGEAEP
ncbi:sulfatase [Deinococcus irradiatisoli]|uniref:Sulfatase n=1 Tax=Deinococcus irradiatisoli TaxID=2202254 RepID=A0A2Z3JJQ1_9DEIO|nr:sulfatase [Deinococcus irradiatisoli]AWN22158.1 sulfatase [Deinococcus irradiatisoli]